MSPVSERAAHVRFRRALSLMVMTLLAPGSAQLVAGNRTVGRVAFRVWLVLVGLLAFVGLAALVDRDLVLWMVTNTVLLWWLKAVLVLAAIAWAGLFIDAWRIGQPLTYGLRHRRATVGVNGILCFSVAGTLLFGAHLVGVQREFMLTMFGDGAAAGAHAGRYNVLLLGGDAGAGRWGLRPDSITVASVDAETGRTVLIGLPRNLENFPFAEGSVMDREFPDGFDADYLNGVATWARGHADLFPDSEHPGAEATTTAVEGITGLEVSYWAMVDLQGFKDLVNAVGGVTLTVREPIPVGGLGADVTGYLEPGTRTLDGFETLWYARSRADSDDYSRMARQKCVLNAMLDQVSPQDALRNFEAIAQASAAMVSTNVPRSEVDRFVSLALQARQRPVSTVSLVPPEVDTADPDVAAIQERVAAAIDRAEGQADPDAEPSRRAGSTGPGGGSGGSAGRAASGGAGGSISEGYAANRTENLDKTC